MIGVEVKDNGGHGRTRAGQSGISDSRGKFPDSVSMRLGKLFAKAFLWSDGSIIFFVSLHCTGGGNAFYQRRPLYLSLIHI